MATVSFRGPRERHVAQPGPASSVSCYESGVYLLLSTFIGFTAR